MERTNVGTVSMDLILDSNKFDNSVKNKTKSTENAFSTSMRKIGTFVASAFAVGTIVNFGKKAVDAASEWYYLYNTGWQKGSGVPSI